MATIISGIIGIIATLGAGSVVYFQYREAAEKWNNKNKV